MKVLMLVTETGCPRGDDPTLFLEGVEYDVPDRLGIVFVKAEFAREVEDKCEKVPESFEDKSEKKVRPKPRAKTRKAKAKPKKGRSKK